MRKRGRLLIGRYFCVPLHACSTASSVNVDTASLTDMLILVQHRRYNVVGHGSLKLDPGCARRLLGSCFNAEMWLAVNLQCIASEQEL